MILCFFFFSSRRRHTRWPRDWSSDVCSSDLKGAAARRRPESKGTARQQGQWHREEAVPSVEIGMIGIGRMGAGMSRRLLTGGHRVIAYDRDPRALEAVTHAGADSAASLKAFVDELAPPRTVWLMVPAGEPTESSVRAVGELLEPGDVLVDGGNSNFRDSIRRAGALAARGLHFLDCSTSGSI